MPPPKKQLIKGLLTSIVPSRGPKRALFLGRHLCFFGGSPAEIPEQNILPKSFTGLAIVSQGWPVGHSFTGAIVSESSCWIHPNQLLGEDFINFPPTSLVFTPLPKLENLGFFRIRFFFQKKTWKHIFPQMLVEFKGDLPWSNPQQHHQKNKSKKRPQSLFLTGNVSQLNRDGFYGTMATRVCSSKRQRRCRGSEFYLDYGLKKHTFNGVS